MTQFDINQYSNRYYRRHFVQYRAWENAIGENIVKTLSPSSIIDLGCGVGSYLEGVLKAGCNDMLGIEISFEKAKAYFVDEIKSYIQYGDITTNLNLNRTFDCVMSFEVAEHIEPESTYAFINNLTQLSDKYIIFTAAPPGQKGTGHINTRNMDFWIKEISSNRFSYQEDMVKVFASLWKEYGTEWYILRNLMVFKKTS